MCDLMGKVKIKKIVKRLNTNHYILSCISGVVIVVIIFIIFIGVACCIWSSPNTSYASTPSSVDANAASLSQNNGNSTSNHKTAPKTGAETPNDKISNHYKGETPQNSSALHDQWQNILYYIKVAIGNIPNLEPIMVPMLMIALYAFAISLLCIMFWQYIIRPFFGSVISLLLRMFRHRPNPAGSTGNQASGPNGNQANGYLPLIFIIVMAFALSITYYTHIGPRPADNRDLLSLFITLFTVMLGVYAWNSYSARREARETLERMRQEMDQQFRDAQRQIEQEMNQQREQAQRQIQEELKSMVDDMQISMTNWLYSQWEQFIEENFKEKINDKEE